MFSIETFRVCLVGGGIGRIQNKAEKIGVGLNLFSLIVTFSFQSYSKKKKKKMSRAL